MSFMNNVNQVISDNMRFVRQYQENPNMLSGASAASAPANAQMQQMMLMMMLMLMQMINPNAQNAAGSAASPSGAPATSASAPDLLSALTAALPIQPAKTSTSTSAADRSLQQNPAYQFLSGKLPVDDTATPDFTDSGSLESRMDALLANSDDPALRTLSSRLRGVNPNGADLAGLRSYVLDRMAQEGRSQTEQAEFKLLFDGLQNNKLLDLAKAKAQAASGTENGADADAAAQVDALRNEQSKSAQAWQALQPAAAANATVDPASLTQSVRQALADNQFTPVQLGQCLKTLMATAPDSAMEPLVGLTGSLMKSGELNINSFLESGYVDSLSPSRRGALLGAVENAGLIMDSGKPNTRFAGYILDTLSRPENSNAKTMVQQFLEDKWEAAGQDPDSNEAQALLSLIVLAGLQPQEATAPEAAPEQTTPVAASPAAVTG